MLLSGGANLENHRQEVNDLNVFPVPDGDTGTNMSLTMSAALDEISKLEGAPAATVAEVTASALLRGARGNSGVILSLLFRGFSKGLAGIEAAGPVEFTQAFCKGVEAAYKAVMKPTEGTMLTVSRLAGDAALSAAKGGADINATLRILRDAAADTLEKTPDMLPILKQAGVVDSGGKGLLYIIEGMLYALNGGGIIKSVGKDEHGAMEKSAGADFSSFEVEDIKYAYCTEFLICKGEKTKGKNIDSLRRYIMNKGDSVVFVDDDEFIKVHVHTDHPGYVMEEALKYGVLSKMKIENMKEQLERERAEAEKAKKAKAEPPAPPREEKEYSFVAVAAGEGIKALFSELGADEVVFGGQTMNPSTEDILKAVESAPGRTVYVFPNNKNIILAAQMVIPMTEKNVVVVPTKSIPEGITAMLCFDATLSAEENSKVMASAAENVKTGQVTYAVRDTEIGGKAIREGQMIGLHAGELIAAGDTAEDTALELAKSMVDENSQIITVFFGEEVEQAAAEALAERLAKEIGSHIDISVVGGGQPVYYYVISVE